MEQVDDKVYMEISGSFARYVTTLLYLSFSVALFYAAGQCRFSWLAPVPFTMQSFAVILTALVYPRRLAIMSQNTVYFMVLAGVPLLSHVGVGMEALLAPTAGYLMGFYVATVFLANSAQHWHSQSFAVWAIWGGLAQVFIWFSGVVWLSLSLGVIQAIQVGLLPFILPDTIKLFAALGLARWLLSCQD